MDYPAWWLAETGANPPKYIGSLIDPCNLVGTQLCDWEIHIEHLCDIISQYELMGNTINQECKLKHEQFIRMAYINLLQRHNTYARSLIHDLLSELQVIRDTFDIIPECLRVCDIPTDDEYMDIYALPKFRDAVDYGYYDYLTIRDHGWEKVINEIADKIKTTLENYKAKRQNTKNIKKFYYDLVKMTKDLGLKSGDKIEISVDSILSALEFDIFENS